MTLFSRACAVFFSIVCVSVLAEFVVPSALAGRVLDEMNLLTPSEKEWLEQDITSLEAETKSQIGIAIIKSLQGRTIEEAGIAIARTWWIGQKWLDNGLLILIAPTEREMRIEVGRGLEGVITDVISNRIIDEKITPEFKKEAYYVWLSSAITSIESLLRGEQINLQDINGSIWDQPQQQDESLDSWFSFLFNNLIFIIIVGNIIWVVFFAPTKSWWLGIELGFLVGAIAGVYFTGILWQSLIAALIGGGTGGLLDYLYSTGKIRPGKWGGRSGGGWFSSSGSSSHSGGSSGWFWGGWFSGGGASGRW